MINCSKNKILWHGALLCVVVDIKNNKLEFLQKKLQNVSQKVLSSINMYRFQSKRPRYDHFHSIVCDKIPIFGTYVCFGMANNVAELIFFKLFV